MLYKKSLKIFDNIVVAISESNQKNQLFSTDERIEIVNKALFYDLKMKKIELKLFHLIL